MTGLHLEGMRGEKEKQAALMVTVTPEELVPADHPIRIIKKVADEAGRFSEVRAPLGVTQGQSWVRVLLARIHGYTIHPMPLSTGD